MKRRGFMGSIAAALAVKPSSQIEAISGGLGPPAIANFSSMAPPSVTKSWAKREKLKTGILKLLNPEWFDRKRKKLAKNVNQLDVDIASFQSVSVAGKIAMQRERNYKFSHLHEYEWSDIREAEEQFDISHGYFE